MLKEVTGGIIFILESRGQGEGGRGERSNNTKSGDEEYPKQLGVFLLTATGGGTLQLRSST